MDEESLKAGVNIGSDYFDKMLERIRDIRSSEKRFYQKVRDISKGNFKIIPLFIEVKNGKI